MAIITLLEEPITVVIDDHPTEALESLGYREVVASRRVTLDSGRIHPLEEQLKFFILYTTYEKGKLVSFAQKCGCYEFQVILGLPDMYRVHDVLEEVHNGKCIRYSWPGQASLLP